MADEEFQTRFEELDKRRKTRNGLRLLAWSLPLILALVLLWVARDESSLIADGVAGSPAFKKLGEEVSGTRENVEKLSSSMGDQPLDAEFVLNGLADPDEPVTVVTVLKDHSDRLRKLETPADTGAEVETLGLPESAPVIPGVDREKLGELEADQDRLADGLENSAVALESLRSDLAKLSDAEAERNSSLVQRLDEAAGNLDSLRTRIERLEQETAYRSLTVREGDVASLLTLGLKIAPGSVEKDFLEGFSITDRGGTSIRVEEPRVELGKPNSFEHQGCRYSFAVSRHRRSILLRDHLDIELLRSCAGG